MVFAGLLVSAGGGDGDDGGHHSNIIISRERERERERERGKEYRKLRTKDDDLSTWHETKLNLTNLNSNNNKKIPYNLRKKKMFHHNEWLNIKRIVSFFVFVCLFVSKESFVKYIIIRLQELQFDLMIWFRYSKSNLHEIVGTISHNRIITESANLIAEFLDSSR